MSTKVLITGSAGYLGGRLAQHLSRQHGWRVRCGVRPGAGTGGDNTGPGEVVAVDVLDDCALLQACANMDAIVHLAALNDADCRRSPERAFLVNCVGTQKLVDAAITSGVSRLVYVSTAHVYGAPLAGTISEATIPRPVSCYAITHRAAEDIVLAAHQERRIGGLVLRLSNAFGAPIDARVNAWMLLANNLCREAVTAGTLTLRSSGLDWRDFVPMTDAVTGITHALTMSRRVIGDGVFNLGGNAPMRVLDFAHLVAARCREVLGFDPPITRPLIADERPAAPAINYRLDKLIATGYTPTRRYEQEVDDLLRFCAGHFRALTATS